mmetsp:Transcript_56454/g.104522  ORF Transcript_56454/g.104522 Transcript_56454/m.104522 type:complete len:337 (-) Transcript_56454:45-1055(-)
MAVAVLTHGDCPKDRVESTDADLAMALFKPFLPADSASLRRIYLRLALKYHPDKKRPQDQQAATRLFQAIAKVYEDLTKIDDSKASQRIQTRVRSPVAAAAELGDIAELRQLLEDFPGKVCEPDDLGVVPLMFAATGGCVAAADLLLNAGADVHARNNINWSVLLYAALADHADMVDFLVQRGAVVTQHELILTSFTGNSTSLGALLRHYDGKAGTIRTNESGKTLLHLACEGMCFLKRAASQHAKCIQLLLEAQVPLNIEAQEGGRTCLQNYVSDVRWRTRNLEASAEHMEVLEQLCSAGANVLAKDWAGETAISLAEESGLQEVRAVLQSHIEV